MSAGKRGTLRVWTWHDGRREHVVAATTQRAAAAAFGCSLLDLRGYGRVTEEPQRVAAAMSSPGAVFVRPLPRAGEAPAFERKP